MAEMDERAVGWEKMTFRWSMGLYSVDSSVVEGVKRAEGAGTGGQETAALTHAQLEMSACVDREEGALFIESKGFFNFPNSPLSLHQTVGAEADWWLWSVASV